MKTCYFKLGIILLVLAACGKNGTDEPAGPVTPPEENAMIMNGQTIKIMTYNIHHANPPAQTNVIDVGAIATIISREKPDIVTLQEVDVKTQRSGLTLDQAQNLAARTGMKVYFSKSIDFQGGEYGNAVLSRFPIQNSTRYELPVPAGSPSSIEKRSLALIEVKAEGNKKIFFASTHLEVSDLTTRNLQVDRIREISAGLNAPLFVGGDFNAQPGSESINRLLGGAAFRSGCINNNCPYTYSAQSPTRTIDFVFLNDKAGTDFSVLDYKALNEPAASDHLPVVCSVKYK